MCSAKATHTHHFVRIFVEKKIKRFSHGSPRYRSQLRFTLHTKHAICGPDDLGEDVMNINLWRWYPPVRPSRVISLNIIIHRPWSSRPSSSSSADRPTDRSIILLSCFVIILISTFFRGARSDYLGVLYRMIIIIIIIICGYISTYYGHTRIPLTRSGSRVKVPAIPKVFQ